MIKFVLLALLTTGAPVYLGTYENKVACDKAKMRLVHALPEQERGSNQRIVWMECQPTNQPVKP